MVLFSTYLPIKRDARHYFLEAYKWVKIVPSEEHKKIFRRCYITLQEVKSIWRNE